MVSKKVHCKMSELLEAAVYKRTAKFLHHFLKLKLRYLHKKISNFFHEEVQNGLYFHNITLNLMLDDFKCMKSLL